MSMCECAINQKKSLRILTTAIALAPSTAIVLRICICKIYGEVASIFIDLYKTHRATIRNIQRPNIRGRMTSHKLAKKTGQLRLKNE